MLQIIKDNVLTLFNFLNVMIAVLLFMAGAYSNMLFILIVLLNIVIGVTQEIKAKRMVEKLSILNRPQVLVLRDGEERTVEPEEIVRGDVMILEAGRQICNDAEVLSGSVEVDESLLTGESDPVVKEKGDALYSGSFVVAGRCRAQVVHVGEENYAEKLADEVKKRKATKSLLRDSMRSVTRYTSFLIIPNRGIAVCGSRTPERKRICRRSGNVRGGASGYAAQRAGASYFGFSCHGSDPAGEK